MDTMEPAVSVTREKENFLNTWDNEIKITLRVLQAYPAGKDNLIPAPPLRTAAQLAGVFVGEVVGVAEGVTKGQIDWSSFENTPPTVKGVIAILEKESGRVTKGVRAMTEEEWNSEIEWPVGPKKMGKVRRADALWMALHDVIHHRGQFSIYVRMAGGKVPSIYGPTAEEPWW